MDSCLYKVTLVNIVVVNLMVSAHGTNPESEVCGRVLKLPEIQEKGKVIRGSARALDQS